MNTKKAPDNRAHPAMKTDPRWYSTSTLRKCAAEHAAGWQVIDALRTLDREPGRGHTAARDADEPYALLANAIILNAAEDYCLACRMLRRGDSEFYRDLKKDCLSFFRSRDFRTLTALDPEWLIQRLDEKAEHDVLAGVSYSRLEKQYELLQVKGRKPCTFPGRAL